MTSRMSNDGIVDGLVDHNLPPTLIQASLLDGTSITLHGQKWDGTECELLDTLLPPPFCTHLLKSPIFFTGEFKSLAAALSELAGRARLTSPSPAVAIPNLPFSFRSASMFNKDMSLDAMSYCDRGNDVYDEDAGELAERMSCDEEFVFNFSSEEEEDECHSDCTALEFDCS